MTQNMSNAVTYSFQSGRLKCIYSTWLVSTWENYILSIYRGYKKDEQWTNIVNFKILMIMGSCVIKCWGHIDDQMFWARYCYSGTPLSIFLFWRISWSVNYDDDSTLLSLLSFPSVWVTVEEWVSEWFDLWGMKLNASKTMTKIISRSRTMHLHAVTRINYWRKCAERVWWPWYIGIDIRFQDDF